jgi:hypothetical protein
MPKIGNNRFFAEIIVIRFSPFSYCDPKKKKKKEKKGADTKIFCKISKLLHFGCLQTLLKKFPVCCSAAQLLIYIYIYCMSTVWFCVEFRPTETEKDRGGRRLGWSTTNSIYLERRKKIKENETAWRKNPTHFPASEKRKESKISDLKIPMFAIENWQVLLAKCPSFSRSFFSESVVSTCFWWL